MPQPDFDFAALFAALDAQRRERVLSWAALGRELRPPVSASTILRTERGGPMEADGILAMTRWLGVTFAAFTTGLGHAPSAARRATTNPYAEPTRRFDTAAVAAALEEQRASRGLTWHQVAAEIGGAEASALASLGRRSRMRVPEVVRIAAWLGRAPEDFTRPTAR